VLAIHADNAELAVDFAVKIEDVSAIALLSPVVAIDELVVDDGPGGGVD
jgi:hypothetical protein